MNSYTDFNTHNSAPPGTRHIVVTGDNGRIGRIRLPSQMIVPVGEKQYSFLALSDAHIDAVEGSDADVDFIRAMQYAENTDVAFTCICGDVCDGFTEWIFGRYAGLKSRYATKPVRGITGNHDIHTGNTDTSDEAAAALMQYYGDPLYYSFTHGDDVFIMLGEYGWTDNTPFAEGELQFLYETLETNRNKRCFVFFHIFSQDEGDSGLPSRTFYDSDIYTVHETNAVQKTVFLSLLRHYKNTVWFHGHSHAKFELQALNDATVYSELCGYRSVHIPSLSKPKNYVNGSTVTELEASQGYAVDVYAGHIVLRGRDFVSGKFLPIATYCLDTTLHTVEAGTYTDSTGMIRTT